MNIYHNKYKYQLIHPVVGTRIYQTRSLKKGAKKCYEELKSFNNINSPYFTVLNVDTFEIYKFKIDATNTKAQGVNGKLNDTEFIKKIDRIQETISGLILRIQKLEDNKKINSERSEYKKVYEPIEPTIATNMDSIMAEAVSKNIYNLKKFDKVHLLDNDFNSKKEILEDPNQISGSCTIM